jgi:hypothetical protein
VCVCTGTRWARRWGVKLCETPSPPPRPLSARSGHREGPARHRPHRPRHACLPCGVSYNVACTLTREAASVTVRTQGEGGMRQRPCHMPPSAVGSVTARAGHDARRVPVRSVTGSDSRTLHGLSGLCVYLWSAVGCRSCLDASGVRPYGLKPHGRLFLRPLTSR